MVRADPCLELLLPILPLQHLGLVVLRASGARLVLAVQLGLALGQFIALGEYSLALTRHRLGNLRLLSKRMVVPTHTPPRRRMTGAARAATGGRHG